MSQTEMMPLDVSRTETTPVTEPGATEDMGSGSVILGCRHDSMREGARIGLVVATSIWVWIALVDAIAGQPFHTFAMLGGVVAFTVMHYLLNMIYGVVLVSTIHGSVRAPSLMFALGFGYLVFEFAFAFLTVVLSNVGLGELAWVRIFGGNVIGTVIAFTILARRHPLVALLHQAEAER